MVKKQLIMEKSLELFAENGFEATSVQQITERCGISKGAFYLHFKSKDELISSLIDHFMTEVILKIEQAVSSETEKEKLLYQYLYASLHEFQQKASFAKILLTENVLAFNQYLFGRLQIYMGTINQILLSIVQRQFAQKNHDMHLDVVFTINGLVKSYSELFLFNHYKVDLDKICRSIEEKVILIAEYATIQIITPDYFAHTIFQSVVSKEQVIQLLNEAMEEISEDAIILESLQLLKDHLLNPTLSAAIVQGLLNNIRKNSHCHWVAYLYSLCLNNKSQ